MAPKAMLPVPGPHPPCWRHSLRGSQEAVKLRVHLQGSLKSIPLIGKTCPHALNSGDSFQMGYKPIVKDPLALFTRVGEFVLDPGKTVIG